METKRNTITSNSLLWFGASISIAEIMTGGLIAPLGFEKGFLAIIIGHIIGCILLYLVGTISGNTKFASIKSSRISFGEYGSYIFSILNIIQLIGWTAVMIISGAKALDIITVSLFDYSNQVMWAVLIGALIILWVVIGIKSIAKLNIFVVSGLLILCIILGTVIFGEDTSYINLIPDNMSFGLAVELSIAMCLSWLPLIGDYTSISSNPKIGTISSTIAYFIGSSFMYTIGLGGAIYAGTSDISEILLTTGLGIIAVFIVVLSTVTTTFLDVYSAGISFTNITEKINTKKLMVVIAIIGMIIAIMTSIEKYQDFLLLIGSVFSPMISILIADFFLLKKKDITYKFNITNTFIWIFGFILYRKFMELDTVFGSTIPVIFIIILSTFIVAKIKYLISKEN